MYVSDLLQLLCIFPVFDQKGIDIETLEFLPLLQVDLCLFLLFLQGGDLFFQFTQNIRDTDQVFFFALQAPERHLLPVLVFDDTGRFIKKSPSVLRLVAQDPVDLARCRCHKTVR